MGYRSDVAIVLYKEDFDELCKRIARSEDNTIKDLFESADINLDGDEHSLESIVTIFFYDVKWYDEFKDVDFLMDFLHESGRRYSFKRIGEDLTDIDEEWGDSDYDLGEVVSIVRRFDYDAFAPSELDAKKIIEELSDEVGESVDSGISFEDMLK